LNVRSDWLVKRTEELSRAVQGDTPTISLWDGVVFQADQDAESGTFPVGSGLIPLDFFVREVIVHNTGVAATSPLSIQILIDGRQLLEGSPEMTQGDPVQRFDIRSSMVGLQPGGAPIQALIGSPGATQAGPNWAGLSISFVVEVLSS